MLAEDLHHASVWGEVIIVRNCFGDPGPVCRLKNGPEPIRRGFVGAKDAKVLVLRILSNHVPQKIFLVFGLPPNLPRPDE